MHTVSMRIFVYSAIALTVLFGRAQDALASVGLSIAPTSLTAGIDPGMTYTNSVLLTNTDSAPVQIKVFPRSFKANEQDNQDATTLFSDKVPLPSSDIYKLVLSPDSFSLDPGETREVSLTITTAKSTPAGGYYVGAVFQTVPDTNPKAPVGQSIMSEINLPILTQVSGDLTTSAEIVSFKADKSVYSQGPVKFELRMKNTGNVHFPPMGRVDIYAEDGKRLDSVQFKGDNILPNDTRATTIEWTQKSPPVGKKTATVRVFWGEEKYEQETSFEVLPGVFSSIASKVLLALGGLLLLFLLLGRRKKKRTSSHRR